MSDEIQVAIVFHQVNLWDVGWCGWVKCGCIFGDVNVCVWEVWVFLFSV